LHMDDADLTDEREIKEFVKIRVQKI
jgi:hypothetical protein